MEAINVRENCSASRSSSNDQLRKESVTNWFADQSANQGADRESIDRIIAGVGSGAGAPAPNLYPQYLEIEESVD